MNLHSKHTKNEAKKHILDWLKDLAFEIEEENFDKPWGGYVRISEEQIEKFVKHFFPKEKFNLINQKLSPKILLVQPNKRLSWQYHFRREEIWKVVHGPVGIVRSKTNEHTQVIKHEVEMVIKLEQEERHRLVGQENWGVVAEIWSHTDASHPSNEADIVRLEDDFKRN